jgi:hypothetical protein
VGIFVALIGLVILGALLGGNSFGETVRKGCGFIIALVINLAILIAVLSK